MKQFFGFLFLIIAVILVFIQIGVYNTSLFLFAFITTLSLVCAILALVSEAKQIAGGIAFIPCIILIIAMVYQLLTKSDNLDGKHGFLIYYLIIFAIYGAVGVSSDD